MAVPITVLYGALNAILNVALAANVSRVRGKAQVFLGTGDSEELLLASRRHANNMEYVPLALVMLLLAELSGGGSVILHCLGGSLFLGRVCHAIGVGSRPHPLRVVGALLSWLVIVVAAVYALVLRYA
jgi:uncharacterized membrane protein YecN with MAPEG domain